MSDDDFLAALSAVDAGFADHPSWQQVKQLAALHPWTLGSQSLTPGQQSVLAFWRIFSRDDQGRSAAPMPGEGTAEQILQSLSDFQEDFETAVLTNTDFDLTSIEQVFASLSSGASAADPPG
ncbi:hypothetical protein KUL97_04660 [Synechococcus sp. HK05]|uniref:hypothetical protein n=1 Tax=Synechococcus sp. HK05 TaxID=2725975 RepID=UPI001C38399D|nr:hypothetical protein [Synechococcus sp. HK05]MBV2350999.1 hypothetical protein [Synechococcus sp. HK05]